MPSAKLFFHFLAIIGGMEPAVDLPLLVYFFSVFPVSYGKSGKICGSESCRLCHFRAKHLRVEYVALELH